MGFYVVGCPVMIGDASDGHGFADLPKLKTQLPLQFDEATIEPSN